MNFFSPEKFINPLSFSKIMANPTNVLITGIEGFIGSHLARYLIAKGISVYGTVYDLSKTDRLKGLEPLQLYEADIMDFPKISKIVADVNPDHIFHLAAALKNKGTLTQEIRHTLDLNVNGTVNLLEASKNLGLKSFIFPSTLEVNGNGAVPFTEHQKENPITPYSLSKFFAEKYCKYYHEVFSVPIKIVRFPLLYGSSQEPVMFIPFVMQSILSKQNVMLYSQGLQTRDFLHIHDAVDALWEIANSSAVCGKVINICSGQENNLRRVVEVIESVLGIKANIELIPHNYREQEIMRYVGDNRLAKELLGWSPRYSLEEGMRLMLQKK